MIFFIFGVILILAAATLLVWCGFIALDQFDVSRFESSITYGSNDVLLLGIGACVVGFVGFAFCIGYVLERDEKRQQQAVVTPDTTETPARPEANPYMTELPDPTEMSSEITEEPGQPEPTDRPERWDA